MPQFGTSRNTATWICAGPASDYSEGSRRLITVADRQVGVFRIEGRFVAYENRCLHAGGPVCEGQLFPRVEAVVDGGGRVLTERSVPADPHLVCPWHGWEYDLRTGEVAARRRLKLSSFPVRIEDGQVYVGSEANG